MSGIISSLSDGSSSDETPPQIPTRFITCNTRQASANRVSKALAHLTTSLDIRLNENLRSVKDADVILLACKPYLMKDILKEHGVCEALENKLLISILAGVSVKDIEEVLYGEENEVKCRIIRALPNTAAVNRESMTMLAKPSPPLSPDQDALVTWIFSKIGRVVQLPAEHMDASTALCGSAPAFYALLMEAMADGGVAMGIPRAEAQLMAAQTMRGCAGLVLNGEHPAIVREKISSAGGCTIGGLLVLEEGGVRGTVARSIREATVVASQLGKGVQNVNGTRF